MVYKRVIKPWILADLDNNGDVNVTAAPNITISIFRIFIKLKS
jgi:hypothetical protein